MAQFSARDFSRALLKKGFRLDETDHSCYWFYYNGVRTRIWTKVSHGERDFGDGLMALRRRQMRLQTTLQFREFIECSFSEEQCIAHLLEDQNMTYPFEL